MTVLQHIKAKHTDGTPVTLRLYVNDDIEFMTPQEFDPPTAEDLERERQLAAAMNLWVDDYNERMQAKREAWMNEPHYDSEGWGVYE